MVQNNTTSAQMEKATQVSEVLSEGATHIYEVLVGAQPIIGLLMVAQALIVVVPTFYISYRVWKHQEADDPIDEEDRLIATAVAFFIVALVTLSIAMFIGEVFVRIFLPEYSAIQEVLESM